MDAHTRVPLGGARVGVAIGDFKELEARKHLRKPVVRTDDNGRFAVPSEHVWVCRFLPEDVFLDPGTLVVESEDYEPICIPLWELKRWDLIEVLLKPHSK